MKNASSCATCFMQWAKEMLGVTLQPKASFYLLYECRYHQILSNGGEALKPRMPQIDKDGFTKFQLHDFINTFGEYMIVGQKNVIEDICIYMDDEDLEEVE